MNVLLENCLKTIEELTKKIASLENEKLQQKPTMDDSKTENTNIEILTNKISNLSVQKKKYENSENLYINSENSQFDKEINLKDNKVQLVFENNFLQIEKLKRVFYKEKNIILCFAKKKLVENKEGNLVMYLGCPENKCLSKGVLRCVNKNGKLIYVLSIKGAHCHMNSKTNFELSVLDEIKIIEDLSKTSLSPEQIVLQIKKNRSEGLIKNDGILCESSEDIKRGLVERILKNFKWNPSVINLDFAKSNINAIKITFPFSKVHGCGFHFLQAIKRKLMKSKIENQEKVLKKIKSFMTLSTEEIKKRLEEWINKLNLKTNEIENWNMEIENLEKKIEKNSFENYENLSNIETGGPRNVLVLDEKYSKNFKFFQSKIEQKEIEKSTLKDFLQNYFYNTWIKRFNPELWSIYYKKQEIFFQND
ncbi:hypothetical protein M0813_02188 [Anaeramoeba flamelloides]|uniref:MULE transposase domain-containing protein n=1 Tax=Anaeramoeba flamelloides TaxID=1746091 RepID=A0ABQ8YQM9_9EUKA|nr:hypothetical protein M0813_02188 [Anaeramoeba flamelloides]